MVVMEHNKVEALSGLADSWEDNLAIRRSSRELGRLVRWESPEHVGVAGMKLFCIADYF